MGSKKKSPRANANKGRKRKKSVRKRLALSEVAVKINIGEALKRQCRLLSSAMGHPTISAYIRDLIARGTREDLLRNPTIHLSLRPGSTVYTLRRALKETEAGGIGIGSGDVLTPLSQAVGGERVWVLSLVPGVPTALGGGHAYLCDLVADGPHGGVEGRGVVVLVKDVRVPAP